MLVCSVDFGHIWGWSATGRRVSGCRADAIGDLGFDEIRCGGSAIFRAVARVSGNWACFRCGCCNTGHGKRHKIPAQVVSFLKRHCTFAISWAQDAEPQYRGFTHPSRIAGILDRDFQLRRLRMSRPPSAGWRSAATPARFLPPIPQTTGLSLWILRTPSCWACIRWAIRSDLASTSFSRVRLVSRPFMPRADRLLRYPAMTARTEFNSPC